MPTLPFVAIQVICHRYIIWLNAMVSSDGSENQRKQELQQSTNNGCKNPTTNMLTIEAASHIFYLNWMSRITLPYAPYRRIRHDQ